MPSNLVARYGCNPDDPTTWRQPVIRLGDYPQDLFRQAANTPTLHAAFDQLVGTGRWLPRSSLGTFPVRFPHSEDPGDTGWHVDAGFQGDDGSLRLNVRSEGRALLMLFLFSDVGHADAPTEAASVLIWMYRDCWSRPAKLAYPIWNSPKSWIQPWMDRSSLLAAKPAQSISATLSSSTPPSQIILPGLVFWRSPRSIPRNRSSFTATPTTIRPWRSRSGSALAYEPGRILTLW
jgi:hypothetical protein